MNSAFDPGRRHVLLATLSLPGLLLSGEASAHENRPQPAINKVANFNASTWARLLRQGPRPAAYVFTTTYCSTCPEVFELLHETITSARERVELAAVVMDAQGERALAHAHHYTGATRIYAFDGFEPEIRQAVDPKWRNITPYVVLIGRQGADQRTIGPPDGAKLRAWLA